MLGLDPEQRQSERRRLVLDAALALFGTQGYVKTSIEALCQRAGVGTNSFYEVFESKEHVLEGIYDQLTETLREAVTASYLQHHDSDDPVRPLVAAFVHGAVDDPCVARVLFVEAAGVSPTIEARRRAARNHFAEGLEAIGRDVRDRRLGTRVVEPALRPGPAPRRNAIAVVGAVVEMTVDWLQDPEPDDVEHLIDDIAHHCRRVLTSIIEESSAG